MRNRLLSIALALLVIAVAIVATTAQTLLTPVRHRTYQHMENPAPAKGTSEGGAFSSHLPLVLIETGGAAIKQDVKTPVMLHVIDNAGGSNRVADTPALTTPTLINLRGKTSASFAKPQYRLNFIRDLDTLQRKGHKVMGMPGAADWVLYGPYLDKTLLRNYLLYNLAGEMMAWAPGVRFCEVFVDGAYEGLYVMTEAISVDEHRVSLSDTADYQGAIGYMVYRNIPGSTKTPIETSEATAIFTGYELGIEFPGPANITTENIAYITDDIRAFEAQLRAMAGGQAGRDYAAAIDMNSFVDYFIINEFAMNRDAGFFSTYAYRDPRGKLTMGPVWDFNNAFDNYVEPTTLDQLLMADANWYYRLVCDSVFDEMVIYRYHQLRKGILNEDRLLQMIDDIAAYLGPAIERNFARWSDVLATPFLLADADGDTRNAYTYEEALQQLKDSIRAKGRFLDENLSALLRALSEQLR